MSDGATAAPAATTERAQKITRFVVAKVDDIKPGERLIVDIGGRSIAIFNVRGNYYGMLNRCPHLGGPLGLGDIRANITSTGQGHMELDESTTWLTCPWHNWEFDITNGQSYWNPDRIRARPFAVEVEAGRMVIQEETSGVVGRVKGPYQAETIEVSVEEEYLVVSLQPIRPGQQIRPAGPADRPIPEREIS